MTSADDDHHHRHGTREGAAVREMRDYRIYRETCVPEYLELYLDKRTLTAPRILVERSNCPSNCLSTRQLSSRGKTREFHAAFGSETDLSKTETENKFIAGTLFESEIESALECNGSSSIPVCGIDAARSAEIIDKRSLARSQAFPVLSANAFRSRNTLRPRARARARRCVFVCVCVSQSSQIKGRRNLFIFRPLFENRVVSRNDTRPGANSREMEGERDKGIPREDGK